MLPDDIICRTRPRKDGSKYTNCFSTIENKSNINNRRMPSEDYRNPSRARRKQPAPQRNKKTVPQTIARKELTSGKKLSVAGGKPGEVVIRNPPPGMTKVPKDMLLREVKTGLAKGRFTVKKKVQPEKQYLKRNVRAGAKGDVRVKPKEDSSVYSQMVELFDKGELDVRVLNKRPDMFIITMKKPFGGKAPNFFVDANTEYRVNGRANYVSGPKGKKAETGSLLIYPKNGNKTHKGFVDGRKKGDPGMTLSMKRLKEMIDAGDASVKMKSPNILTKEWIKAD